MNISWNWVSGRGGAVDGGVAHRSHGDDKGRIVGALYDIVVELNDLLDSRDWKLVSLVRSPLSALLVRTRKRSLSSDLLRLARIFGRHD